MLPADARATARGGEHTAETSVDVAAALQAWLLGQPLPAGFGTLRIGSYPALCIVPALPSSGAATPLLIAADEGALYLFDSAEPGTAAAVEAVLRGSRYRPAGGSLALRLPDDCGGGTGTFRLWATPKYLAASHEGEQVWK